MIIGELQGMGGGQDLLAVIDELGEEPIHDLKVTVQESKVSVSPMPLPEGAGASVTVRQSGQSQETS